MKITKQMLESIIREELQKLDEIGPIGIPQAIARNPKGTAKLARAMGTTAGTIVDDMLVSSGGRIAAGIFLGLAAMAFGDAVYTTAYTQDIDKLRKDTNIMKLERAVKETKDEKKLRQLIKAIGEKIVDKDISSQSGSRRGEKLKNLIATDPLKAVEDTDFKRGLTAVAEKYEVDVDSGGTVTISPRTKVDYKTMQPPTFSVTGEVRENKITKSLLRKLIIEELKKMA